MGELSVIKKMKHFIAGTAIKLFLWGNDMTKEVYWNLIYEQEKLHKER